jgi:hypothetical protein
MAIRMMIEVAVLITILIRMPVRSAASRVRKAW